MKISVNDEAICAVLQTYERWILKDDVLTNDFEIIPKILDLFLYVLTICDDADDAMGGKVFA